MATVAGAYAKTTYKKMVNGAPATAADVNKAHQDLADAIDKFEQKLVALESDPDCPQGYTKDSTAATITLCKSTGGSDEMVKVGSY